MFKVKIFIRLIISKIKRTFLSFIPSHVKAFYYLTESNIKCIKLDSINYSDSEIYSDKDYYIIHYWNRCLLTTKYYFIKTKNICDVFQVKSINYLKYIDKRYYYEIIDRYIKKNINRDIFHIEINRKDASKELYKYKESLNGKDIDTKSILLLNTVCDIISNGKKIDQNINQNLLLSQIKLYNYDLEEI